MPRSPIIVAELWVKAPRDGNRRYTAPLLEERTAKPANCAKELYVLFADRFDLIVGQEEVGALSDDEQIGFRLREGQGWVRLVGRTEAEVQDADLGEVN